MKANQKPFLGWGSERTIEELPCMVLAHYRCPHCDLRSSEGPVCPRCCATMSHDPHGIGYTEWRDEKVEEARRDGITTLILPLPNGGEERIDLRLQ